MNAKLLIIALLLNTQAISAKIRIVLTAALTQAHYEFRKNEYIESFTSLKRFGYCDFYIVEAVTKGGPTFLDTYCNDVFYATANDPLCTNQGVNESKTMLEALIGLFPIIL